MTRRRVTMTRKLTPEGRPPSTFDAEDAVLLVASVFDEVTWNGKFFPLRTRDEVRAYCRHNFVPMEQAESVEVPLWLTKRGTIVRARKAA
jgi:hypothetical protein